MNDGYMLILNEIASDSPTPGGGTVAGLTLAHAYALASMVSRLTIDKKKWEKGHKISSKIINNINYDLDNSVKLAIADSSAFDKVMDSYRLPKNSEDEVHARNMAILNSTIGAAQAPFDIAKEGFKLLSMLPELAEYCNLNAITDLASSSELAYTAVYIASLNVKINVDSNDDSSLKEIQNNTSIIVSGSDKLIKEIREIVARRMNN